MIKAVLFDLDETLIDRKHTMQNFLMGQYQRFTDLHGCQEEEYVKTCLHYQRNGYADKFTAYTAACDVLGMAGSPLVNQLFEDFKERYGKHPVLFLGVVEALEILSERYRLGLVTNGTIRAQTSKINATGIAGYFSSICISEAVGCKKPDRAIFNRCLDELSVSTDNAVFVGDNPIADIKPAKALGMRAIWLRSEYFNRPVFCDTVISGVRELPALLLEDAWSNRG